MRNSTALSSEPTRRSLDRGRIEFRILVICTGNLFRSPLAAGLLQQGFDEVAPADSESIVPERPEGGSASDT